jgi:uncharacterized protein (UPF0332 family)
MDEKRREVAIYRLDRAKATLDDARLLAQSHRWNSAINRLYYAAFYAITALLTRENLEAATHKGVKQLFSAHFIQTGKISLELGKAFSQLFTWRQKGDYDDLFDFTEEKIAPYFEPVEHLIEEVEKYLGA